MEPEHFGVITPVERRRSVAQVYGLKGDGDLPISMLLGDRVAAGGHRKHSNHLPAPHSNIKASAGKGPTRRNSMLKSAVLPTSVKRFKHLAELKVGRDSEWRRALGSIEKTGETCEYPIPHLVQSRVATAPERLMYPLKTKGLLTKAHNIPSYDQSPRKKKKKNDERSRKNLSVTGDRKGVLTPTAAKSAMSKDSMMPDHLQKAREEAYAELRCVLDEEMGFLQFDDQWSGLLSSAATEMDILQMLKLSC